MNQHMWNPFVSALYRDSFDWEVKWIDDSVHKQNITQIKFYRSIIKYVKISFIWNFTINFLEYFRI